MGKMNRDELIAAVSASYAAFKKRDVATICALSAEDCVYESPGVPEFMPWAHKHHGHAGIHEFVGLLYANLEFNEFVARDFVTDEASGRVVVLGRARCTYYSTGRRYVNEWAHLFEFRDGKVSRFREFPDTAAQLIAVHPKLG